jgi:hypothetical protein
MDFDGDADGGGGEFPHKCPTEIERGTNAFELLIFEICRT